MPLGNLDLADIKLINDEAQRIREIIRDSTPRDTNELSLHQSVLRLTDLLFLVTEGMLEEHGIKSQDTEEYDG